MMDKDKDQMEENEGTGAGVAPQKVQIGKLVKISGEDQEPLSPDDEDDDSDIPQEGEEGFDTNFKDVAKRVTVSKKQVHDEDQTSEEEKAEVLRIDSKKQIEDRFEIVDSETHEEVKDQKRIPLKRQSTLIQKDDNGEKVLAIEEDISLIFPQGNKSILVKMKISSFHLTITHVSSANQTPGNDSFSGEEESDNSEDRLPFYEDDESLQNLIQNQ